MLKSIPFVLLLATLTATTPQNIFITKSGKISFSSRSKIEKIEADNNEVSSVFNTSTNELVFSLLLKSFHLDRALMEEHFNENYVESDKYPKSTFKGMITNPPSDYSKDGSFNVSAGGELTLHGVTKPVTATGIITVKNGRVSLYSKFNIKLRDYNISIPSLVADKISEDIDITVDCKYEPKN